MSLGALLIATRDCLRNSYTGLPEAANSVRIMQDDRPSPKCGQEFIGIIGSSWTPGDQGLLSIHERYNLTIAITRRTTKVAWDHRGEQAYVEDTTLYDQIYKSVEQRARETIKIIIQRQLEVSHIASCAVYPESGFLGHWEFSGGDGAPTIVGPDHFHSSDTENPECGLLYKVNFTGPYRIQSSDLAEQTIL